MSRPSSPLVVGLFVVVLAGAAGPVASATGAGEPAGTADATSTASVTSCVACHGDPDLFDDEGAALVAAVAGGHGVSGPSCHDCHGGNPDPALADDMDAAMDPAFAPAPYRGVPAAAEVGRVCGACHGREAALFAASAKAAGYREHAELVEGMDGCADCHEEPTASVTSTSTRGIQFSACGTCHDPHAVPEPTFAQFGFLPATPCAVCHESVGGGPAVLEPPAGQRRYEALRAELVAAAEDRGLSGSALFDHLLARAHDLPEHRAEADAGRPVREEFLALSSALRLGRVPAGSAAADIRRCTDCHAEEPDLADAPIGWTTARQMAAGLREVAMLTARAERMAAGARRRGVDAGDALASIDQAVAALVELQVLVHGFDAAPGSELDQKRAEARGHAEAALAAAERAEDEVAVRRRGLYVALGLILIVLVALGLYIHRLPVLA